MLTSSRSLCRIWWCWIRRLLIATVQHCLFIEALGYLGEGNVTACEDVMTRLLAINPAHDKVHLLRHALICGIFA
ncbi:Uncharacterised protein [Yokenella regensburgei]|nr:Uncharacterised protein [Yokenella regensburgei]